MKALRFAALVLCSAAGAALAQDPNFGVSAGLKAWRNEWTTFGYDTNGAGQTVVLQVPAKTKVVFIPQLSARWRDFVASVSGYSKTDFEFVTGGSNTREEFDANVGYLVAPGVALTLGYKKMAQRVANFSYELDGPIIGLSATASIGGPFSMYGAVGLGPIKSTSSSNAKFDADYRLTEVGFAYTLGMDRWLRSLTFTAGYRMQVLNSKEALGPQAGRDLTQGFALGVVAAF